MEEHVICWVMFLTLNHDGITYDMLNHAAQVESCWIMMEELTCYILNHDERTCDMLNHDGRTCYILNYDGRTCDMKLLSLLFWFQ